MKKKTEFRRMVEAAKAIIDSIETDSCLMHHDLREVFLRAFEAAEAVAKRGGRYKAGDALAFAFWLWDNQVDEDLLEDFYRSSNAVSIHTAFASAYSEATSSDGESG